ncbi:MULTISPECIES: hypothetical protein [unclassified Achromobacter]|uniref:hypothetical protein n=1 Tax=unclassified Achromobacter TaxID=2626865 RepID=UPI000B51695A|nr:MULTISPECIES: hypothetical protein [unclassified Achromobacter]OWT80779.1 hypothetical protein CEY05_05245 [Achromobacter sp. HZ34]OWT81295.1 hypothetical protein CEY04_05235 [Achromobacter sp. HZ28]
MPHNDHASSPTSGPIAADGKFPIDLTGPGSHVLVRERGVGRLVIGPAALGKKADLHVEPHERIDWTVFDNFCTPAGSDWPRFLDYTGADTGFFEWARRRRIETMTWTAVLPGATTVDASQARIGRLIIRLGQAGEPLRIRLPARELESYFLLNLMGDLARITVEGDVPQTLMLTPGTGKTAHRSPYRLPDVGALRQVESLMLQNDPLAQPISLECLADFPNLKSLALHGAFQGLGQLAALTGLQGLALRFMPDLEGLPSLDAFPALDSIIAYNVGEAAGKRLRQQIKARAAVRAWGGHASVTQLRKPEWWEREYGRPFAAWPARLAKIANTAYDDALAGLSQARDLALAQAVFTAFTERFNTLKGIETPERDDLGTAVLLLSRTPAATALGVTEEQAQRWFDERRDY